jgi:hypothetical protein
MVSVLAIGPKVRRLNPAEAMDLMDNKNTEHDFLRRGNKVLGPMSFDFTSCKNHLQI